ncbi:MAG: hypothetical protein WAO56_04235 [Miniphocaeibacter sp.]|uniref:hypothetical protein n=1 Tax=Miniphocaeibacter sp. TaxID=3100973 RepID=UPI00180F6C62|nr:V-type ATPase 116kDa subunit family protein [Gallicola sp.]
MENNKFFKEQLEALEENLYNPEIYKLPKTDLEQNIEKIIHQLKNVESQLEQINSNTKHIQSLATLLEESNRIDLNIQSELNQLLLSKSTEEILTNSDNLKKKIAGSFKKGVKWSAEIGFEALINAVASYLIGMIQIQ